MKRLLILSGKGGTGKTTTASAFIQFGGVRAFADCDVDAPNLHLVSKMRGEPETSVYYGSNKSYINSAICTGCGACYQNCRFGGIKKERDRYRVDEYACEGCGICEYICPTGAAVMRPDEAGKLTLYREEKIFSTARLKMGRGNSGKLVSSVKLALEDALEQEGRTEELAVVDGSPGIGCPVISSIIGMHMVLVVAEPSLSGLGDMIRVLQVAKRSGTKAAVCVNKWDTGEAHAERIKEYCREQEIPFVGMIPYDPAVSKAVNAGISIADTQGPAKQALFEVYKKTITLLNGDE